jgi:hypothetical protein
LPEDDADVAEVDVFSALSAKFAGDFFAATQRGLPRIARIYTDVFFAHKDTEAQDCYAVGCPQITLMSQWSNCFLCFLRNLRGIFLLLPSGFCHGLHGLTISAIKKPLYKITKASFTKKYFVMPGPYA